MTSKASEPGSGARAVQAARAASAAVALLLASVAFGQQPSSEADAPATASSPDAAVEAYMDHLGLRSLLADHLAERLRQSTGVERKPLAERLAAIYVEMLGKAATAAERLPWEARGRELLKLVPEADSHDLRINLAKASYLHAEEIVERHRVRLATTTETAEADRVLRTVRAEFADVASKAHARVESLERAEQAGKESEQLTKDLADARRLRSLAFYYAGWSEYYLGVLSAPEAASKLGSDAMRSFGWLLGAKGGAPASLERLSPGLLKYEHIARASIGCAMAAGLKGSDVEAVRWLNAVSDAPELPDAIKEQLLPRSIVVLSGAKRWADLDVEIRRARKADRNGGGKDVTPLPTPSARLLAVVTLEADRRVAGEVLDRLATIALGDLIARGEIQQVLDLVQRYGTAPIGESGFVVNFVRAVQAYDQARSLHRNASQSAVAKGDSADGGGTMGDEPTRDEAAITRYRQAVGLFEAALRQPDVSGFPAERTRAARLLGLAHFYAGDLDKAATCFLSAADGAAEKDAKEELLWLAVGALDRASKAGLAGAEQRRDRAAATFLETCGDSPRAAQLLVAVGSAKLLDDESALKILLGVPKSSPGFEGARRQAARLLYQMYRSAKPDRRDFAAVRFVAIAEELLTIERKAALEASPAEARAAAERVVTRARQILDATLSTAGGDIARARAALDAIDAAASQFHLDLSEFKDELEYRRLQIAVAMQDASALRAALASIRAADGPYADAADRLLYRTALAAWQRQPTDAAARDAVIEFGERIFDRILAQHKGDVDTALAEPGVASLCSNVAEAAARAADASGNPAPLRDLSRRLDNAILHVQPRSEGPLRRLAATSEAAGDSATAIDCWQSLGAGMEAGAPGWFEARYNAARLLAEANPGKAIELLSQLQSLYPTLGPEPWGAKLRSLKTMLDSKAPQPPPTPVGSQKGAAP